MKNLKCITAILFVAFLAFTSCQDELDSENGQNPNTNTADSQTANNLKRTSMYDGSFDDFLDGMSCSSIILPVVAKVNDIQVNILTQSDYQLVLDILGEITNDIGIITFQFPLTVKTSNYTEIVVKNQAEYDALMDTCETLENEGKSAISCIDIDFPITILTYSLTLEQTGSVVIESEQELYTYMNNFGNNELFTIKYPIAATLNNETVISITSDLDLQTSISDCLDIEETEDTAEAEAKNLETILVDGSFKVQSFINDSIDKTTEFVNYTIDFSNDLTCTAVNATIDTVEGSYKVTSETEVSLDLTFSENAAFSLLNHTWKVTSFNNASVSLKSTTNAAVTLVLTQI